MRSGALTLFRLLLILAVFCCPGFSIQCYNCGGEKCLANTTCKPNLDACLILKHGIHIFRACWRFADCDPDLIASRLDYDLLRYECCQDDFCNLTFSGAVSLSGKTVLLVTTFLAAAWSLCH